MSDNEGGFALNIVTSNAPVHVKKKKVNTYQKKKQKRFQKSKLQQKVIKQQPAVEVKPKATPEQPVSEPKVAVVVKQPEEKPKAIAEQIAPRPIVEQKPRQSDKRSRKNKKKENSTALKDIRQVDQLDGIGQVLTAPEESQPSDRIFSASTFGELELDSRLVTLLEASKVDGGAGFTAPTTVQTKTIPHVLRGRDVLVKSETGSGKTLAFLLPIIQNMITSGSVSRTDGTLALILTPTRELSQQIYETLTLVLRRFPFLVAGSITGGEKRKSEKARLRKGVNILVATPGRLLDHLQNTLSFKYDKLKYLVLDEADRLLDMGFEQQVSQILQALDKKKEDAIVRQTVLVSATINSNVEKLAELTLSDAVFVDADQLSSEETNDDKTFATPHQLVQHFLVVPAKLRLVALTSFLRKEMRSDSSKIVIFFSTCDAVDFHFKLFEQCKWPNMRQTVHEKNIFGENDGIFRLHGSIAQDQRSATLKHFSSASTGILLCTDVAARGLNLPTVEWIVQYDPPTETRDYVHRVGRTARSGARGRSLLFLLPSETGYLDHLRRHQLNPTALSLEQTLLDSAKPHEFLYSKKKTMHDVIAGELQFRFEKAVVADEKLFAQASQAFHSFVRSYATHSSETKAIFHVRGLHFGHVAKSFALRDTPASTKVKTASHQTDTGTLKKRKLHTDKLAAAQTKIQRISAAKTRDFKAQISEFAE